MQLCAHAYAPGDPGFSHETEGNGGRQEASKFAAEYGQAVEYVVAARAEDNRTRKYGVDR